MRTVLLLLLALSVSANSGPAHKFDVVVYGGTEAGVMAAVAAARSGASVGLVAQGRFLGGLLGAGRSYLEPAVQPQTGGLGRELFERIGKHYGQDIVWAAEPHVVEGYFRQMLRDAGVPVSREEMLREVNSVRKNGRSIRRVIADRGEVFEAAVYIDATYEGDLMAAAGVPFDLPGDESIPQSENYSFVLCASGSADAVPIPKPPGYDPKPYDPWLKFLDALEEKNGRPPEFADLVTTTPLRDGKQAAVIANGSTGRPYLEAGPGARATIWQNHIDYTAGLYHFLANNEQVPERLRKQFRGYGLCEDEFLFTNRWPHQLRVRAGRRMRGDLMLTWQDVEIAQPDSIALASFRDQPFQVPYRVLLPPAKRVRNLLVVGCPSAGAALSQELRHPAAALALGHAAGLAAQLAVADGVPVHEIDTAKLIRTLEQQGAILK